MARVIGIILIAGALALTLILLRPNSAEDSRSMPPLPTSSTDLHEGMLDEVVVPQLFWPVRSDSCADSSDGKSDEQRVAELQQLRSDVLPVLKSSADAEHLMVGALLASWDDHGDALLLLGEAAASNPRDPLIASQILGLCLEVGSCARARPEMEQNLIAADKGNSLAWVQVARSRLKRGDENEALAALRQAASATGLNDYFVEYITAFDRALAASSGLSPYERMIAAVGFGAAMPIDAWMITRDCDEKATGSAEWRDACLRLGERFEHDGRTLITQAVGIGMQISMLELEGDTRPLEQALARQAQFKTNYTSLSAQSSRAIELGDATVFRRYLEVFDSGGELAAMQYLADEVAARLPAATNPQSAACQTP